MPEPIATEYVAIRPDTKGFKGDVDRDVTPVIADLKGKLASLAVGAAVGLFVKGGIAELKEQQQVAAQTEARLKATGGAANVTADQVAALASKEQDLSGADAELVQSGANLLLTFKNVRNQVGAGNDIFDQALHAANDLAHAGFGDLTTTSVQLGKALEDPIVGLAALRRVGVTFSESQRETIKQLVETGRLLEAQKILLAGVEGQVGGAAEAYGTTLAGKMERAKNALDDLKASVVAGAAPALEQLVTVVTPLMDAFTNLPVPLQTVIVGMAGVAAVARPLTAAIDLARGAVGLLQSTVAKGTAAFEQGISSATRYSSAISGVATGAAAVAALAAAYEVWAKSLSDFDAAADKALAPARTKAATASYDELQAMLGRTNQQIGEISDTIDNSHAPWDADYRAELSHGGAELEKFGEGLQRQISQIDALTAATGANRDEITRFIQSEAAAGRVYDSNEALLAAYQGRLDDSTVSAEDHARVVESVVAAYKDEQKAISDTLKATDDFLSGQVSVEQAEIRTRDAIADATAARRDATLSADEQRSAVLDAEQAALAEAKAASDAAAAQALLEGHTLTAADSARIQRDRLAELAAKLAPDDPLRTDLQGFIDQLDHVQSRAISVSVTYGSDGQVVTYDQIVAELSSLGVTPEQHLKSFRDRLAGKKEVGERARGGPVDGTVQVAEEGPELFTDERGRTYLTGQGFVTPAARTRGLADRTPRARAAAVNIVQNIYGSDPRQTAAKATAAAQRATFLSGAR